MEAPTYKIKTLRWLFYFSLFQILAFFAFPAIVFPRQVVIDMECLAALTFGILFAVYSLSVNIYGLFIDKKRKLLYLIMTVLTGGWILWAIITWTYIEHMDYLLR